MSKRESQLITLRQARCWECFNPIPSEKRIDTKFCSRQCRDEWRRQACLIGQQIRTDWSLSKIKELD